MGYWLPRWLGRLYSRLYREFGLEAFKAKDVAAIVGKTAAKVAIYRLRKAGCLFVHGALTGRRRLYRLQDPEAYIYVISGSIKNLDKVPQQRYCRLLGLFCSEILRRKIAIKSVVLFGSVARGDARDDSDTDLLIITDKEADLSKIFNTLIDIESSGKVLEELLWLEDHGVSTHLSFQLMSAERLRRFPPLLLDILMDGIILIDLEKTYKSISRELKHRLRMADAKRIRLADNEWCWILKKDMRFGEVIAI